MATHIDLILEDVKGMRDMFCRCKAANPDQRDFQFELSISAANAKTKTSAFQWTLRAPDLNTPDPRENLIRLAALAIAEVERLDKLQGLGCSMRNEQRQKMIDEAISSWAGTNVVQLLKAFAKAPLVDKKYHFPTPEQALSLERPVYHKIDDIDEMIADYLLSYDGKRDIELRDFDYYIDDSEPQVIVQIVHDLANAGWLLINRAAPYYTIKSIPQMVQEQNEAQLNKDREQQRRDYNDAVQEAAERLRADQLRKGIHNAVELQRLDAKIKKQDEHQRWLRAHGFGLLSETVLPYLWEEERAKKYEKEGDHFLD